MRLFLKVFDILFKMFLSVTVLNYFVFIFKTTCGWNRQFQTGISIIMVPLIDSFRNDRKPS